MTVNTVGTIATNFERRIFWIATISVLSSASLGVASIWIYQFSLALGILVGILSVSLLFLNIPMLLVFRERKTLKRPLPKVSMLFWLSVFDMLNFPRGLLVQLNNRRTASLTVQPSQGHVLLSRCLQWSKCNYNVVQDLSNCINCGKCKIGAIKEACQTKGITVSVESGGTAARRRLQEYAPHLVLAVACDRELVTGILDAPLPVVGVSLSVNSDACSDSDVSIQNFKRYLESTIKGD